jgi:Na+-transporting NADH:ubiquinone oxidoreductase subunit NqrF
MTSVSEIDIKLDEDYDEETYLKEQEEIERLYPNAKFTICVSLQDLDDLVTEETNIVVKTSFNCMCYDYCDVVRQSEYYYISGDKLTNGYIIQHLIEHGLSLDCNHCFLEGFHKSANSSVQYEMVIGS